MPLLTEWLSGLRDIRREQPISVSLFVAGIAFVFVAVTNGFLGLSSFDPYRPLAFAMGVVFVVFGLVGLSYHAIRNPPTRSTDASASNASSLAGEPILYDSRTGLDRAHFITKEYEVHANITIVGTVMNVQRERDPAGRVHIWLRHYFYGGQWAEVIPADPAVSGWRTLRVRFDAKVSNGRHNIVVRVKAEPARRQEYLAEHHESLTRILWTPVECILRVPPAQDCYVRIDEDSVDAVPTSMQLRSIVVSQVS